MTKTQHETRDEGSLSFITAVERKKMCFILYSISVRLCGFTVKTKAYLTMCAAWQLLTFKTSVRNPLSNNLALCLKTGFSLKFLLFFEHLCPRKNHCYSSFFFWLEIVLSKIYTQEHKEKKNTTFWHVCTQTTNLFFMPGQTSHHAIRITRINQKVWSHSYCVLFVFIQPLSQGWSLLCPIEIRSV